MKMLLLAVAGLASAQNFMRQPVGRPSADPVPGLKEVGFDQKLDRQLPLHLMFRDETGRLAALGEYFKTRPVIVAPVYYECPMLCSQILQGLVAGLKPVNLDAGKDFEVLAVSFDPSETPAQALRKKEMYAARYKRPAGETGFHFLTGDAASIQALMAAMGFRYTFDPKTRQFAHASGVLVATPQGRISRYLYGVEYAPRDLRLGLVEASRNQIGSAVDQLLLYCYHYDPATGKYTAAAMNILRLAALATLVALGGFVIAMLRRDRIRRIDLMSGV
ncbi:MAG: SCO family protein [Acidobacteria bacterium]|nr:SCO family protein [Acidobacteriota bacterium]